MRLDPPPGATPLDPDEAADLIPSLATQAELNEFEATNIADAREWCRGSRVVRARLLHEDTWKEVHRRMFSRTWKWAGRYRLTEKSIGIAPWRVPTELRNLSEDATVWVEHASYAPDEALARFHHRLVVVHAFPNGNGRHARLVTDLLSLRIGQEECTWGGADLVRPGEARSTYLAALRSADGHDFGPLTWFLRA